MATENYSSFANGQEESMDVTETQNGDQNNKDEDQRKIFVGGLRAETTAVDLREYFSQYGTVDDASLKTDQYTGRSRGFGFVTFQDPSDVEKVIEAKSHTIGGRNVEPRRALARPGKEPVLKAFVGGLDPSVPESEIKEYFEQYGKVVEIELPFDKVKNQRRAFCFVKFETEEEVELAVKETKQVVSGKTVDVKKGVPPRSDKGGRGGRGGGYGGYGGRGGRGGYGGYGGGWDYDGYGYDSYGYGGYDSYGYGNDYYGNDYYSQGYGGGGGYGGYGGYGKGGRGGGGSGTPRGGAGKSRGRGGRGGSGYHPYNK